MGLKFSGPLLALVSTYIRVFQIDNNGPYPSKMSSILQTHYIFATWALYFRGDHRSYNVSEILLLPWAQNSFALSLDLDGTAVFWADAKVFWAVATSMDTMKLIEQVGTSSSQNQGHFGNTQLYIWNPLTY